MPVQRITLTFNRPGGSTGLILDLDDQQFSQKLMLDYFGHNVIYEPETARMFEQLLQSGDTFLDIGGHVGFFSLFSAGLVGPTGRVFTFEPEQSNFNHLLHHIALNKFSQVLPLPWAVGNTTSVTNLFLNLDNDGGHALWDLARHPLLKKGLGKSVARPVFAIRLDDLFGQSQPGSVKLIKIDTEGNETNVIKGAVNFLRKAEVPAVICEINRFGLHQCGSEELELRTLMANLGYTSYALDRPLPRKLLPTQSLDTNFVFNLLFASPGLQQAVQENWPQSTEEADKRFPVAPAEPTAPASSHSASDEADGSS